jgi:ligand-binding sensor domain-containing protein
LAAAGFTGRSLWRAQKVLNRASARAAGSREIPFSLVNLKERAGIASARRLVAPDFRSVAEFAGDVYVCGRASLARYGLDGVFKQAWYVGADLPPYPLEKLAVRRGISLPELWIATDGAGILIFDGRRFTQLLPAAPPQRKISALLPMSDGRVIFGTPEAGAYLTDARSLKLLHAQFAHSKVTALAGDQEETWIGTRDSGAWLWRSGEATQFESELPDRLVLSIYHQDHKTWVGTPVGVAEFEGQRFLRPLAEGVFAQSLVAGSGVLSIGTADEAVVNVSLAPHVLPVSHSNTGSTPKRSNILGFQEVGGGTLVVSPEKITRLAGGEPWIVPPPGSLSDGHISALHVDRLGRLWIGYFDHGIDIFEDRESRAPTHIESDLLFCVNRIKEDPDKGTIAVATANGLALFDSAARVRRTLDAHSGLIASHVTDLLFLPSRSQAAQSQADRPLAAATPAGISFIENGSISSLSAFQGLVNNHVYTLAEGDGGLLAGTLGGFSLLRGGTVASSSTTANSSLRQNWITASAAAADGYYLGTYGSGVIYVDHNSAISSFRDFARERVEINPNALVIANGSIFAGTAGQGLVTAKVGDTRWRWIRTGLPSLNVTALAAYNGALYAGTDNGMVILPERELPK